jgi:type II secretory pathway pseudopilin PulG
MKKNKFSAFTLIELIISSLIISCVAVAVYSVFSGGISAWKRGKDTNAFERNLRLVTEVMARELRNTFKFSNIPFEGAKDFVGFANTIEGGISDDGLLPYRIGKVSYFINENNVFCRMQQSYAEVFQEDSIGQIKELIPDVVNLSFSFFGYDEQAKAYEWYNTWPHIKQEEQESAALETQDLSVSGEDTAVEDLGLPMAVKIELEFKRTSEEKNRNTAYKISADDTDTLKLVKTVMIPLGDYFEEAKKQ